MSRKRTTSRLHLLTVREIQTAVEGDHSDGGGLMLRVRGESSSWVLRFTSPIGRRREMGLGAAMRGSAKQAGDSLTGARDLAHAAREQLRQGIDPIDERDQRRTISRDAERLKKAAKIREHLTLARAARAYHERAVEPRLTAKHAAQWISSLENHVPGAVWHSPIASIDAPTLLAALAGVRSLEQPGERIPETLQRVRQRLEVVFEDAIFHGHCTLNPAAAIRRKLRETLPAKKAGKFAALPFREAPALMARLRASAGIAARCLEFAVLTTARTNEALGMTWDEVDLDEGTWTVPATKMKAGEEHTVYLSPRALEIINSQRGMHARYVFPSAMLDDKPMSNMSLLAVLDRLGVRKLTTVHGLCRSTFSTWANETAAARPDVIEACLAHRETDRVRQAYNRAKFVDERRGLLAAWSEYLAQPPAQVLSFERVA